MISVEHLHFIAGKFQLRDINFQVPAGAYAVLMGKTGSGKTTLIECICGLRSIKSGRICLGNGDVTGLPPAHRQIGYVPQDGALFPTMTVDEHLAFAPTLRGWDARRRERRVQELAEWLEIAHLLPRRPEGLSGGEAQRVALGRALACDPRVLILDEPLSALDDQTRQQMLELLRRLHASSDVTALHVTHNLAEAAAIAEVRLRLENGEVVCENT